MMIALKMERRGLLSLCASMISATRSGLKSFDLPRSSISKEGLMLMHTPKLDTLSP